MDETQGLRQFVGSDIRRSSLTERLESEKVVLENRLAEIDKALSTLRSDPKLQGIIDMIFRVVR